MSPEYYKVNKISANIRDLRNKLYSIKDLYKVKSTQIINCIKEDNREKVQILIDYNLEGQIIGVEILK